MEEGENRTRKMVITVVVSFVIGFGLSWLIFGLRGSSDSDRESENATTTVQTPSTPPTTPATTGTPQNPPPPPPPPSTGEEKNSIAVDDQSAGSEVKIRAVAIENTAWIVVREDSNGKPGNILGAARVFKGATSATIELLRGTTAGKTYYAAIHTDNGDAVFAVALDGPLKNASGEPIMLKFVAK